jgi:uncharacterized protein
MRAERESDLAGFAARTRAFLGRDPVVHTLICSAVELAGQHPDRFQDASWFSVTGPAGDLVGVAAQAPPYPLAITPMGDAALAALAGVSAARPPGATGASGPVPYVDRFAALWAQRTGGLAQVRRQMRLFRLDAVRRPASAGTGLLRPAGDLPEHRDLLTAWIRAFVLAIEGEPAREPEQLLDRLVERGGLWVWCRGREPVSFASATAPAFASTRIGLVYTPQELRGRGYASACVAALSQRSLSAGLTPVLFTDLANPTSNRIYRQIGYRPVCDWRDYAFTPAPREAPPAPPGSGGEAERPAATAPRPRPSR